MFALVFLSLVAQLKTIHGQALDQWGVSVTQRAESLERLILTTPTLDSLVEPCSKIFDDNPASGEQTSAEWIRIVFHDFVTANVAAGTG
jgi:hypothetical protein